MREPYVEHHGGIFRYVEFPAPVFSGHSHALIYLHGAGERGDDLSLVLRYGLPSLLAAEMAHTNCSVICPQLELGCEWQPQRLASFIAYVRERHEQVALMGYSLGGLGVCEFIARYGSLANPAVAIAGRSNGPAVAPQAGVTFLAIHGELDTWPETRDFVLSVKARAGTAYEVVLPGEGHYISEVALWDPSLQSILNASGFEVARQ